MRKSVLVVASIAFVSNAHAKDDGLDAGPKADPRLLTDTASIPDWGAVFEGNKDGKSLTGRGAMHIGAYHFDFSLSGTDVNKETGRSDLIHSLDKSKGGTISGGITWSSFSVDAYEILDSDRRKLCAEQIQEKSAGLSAALLTDPAYVKSLKEKVEAVGKAAERKKAQEDARSTAMLERQEFEAAFKEAHEKVRVATDEAARLSAQAAVLRAQERLISTMRADAFADSAFRESESADAVLTTASTKEANELVRVRKQIVGNCDSAGDLAADRRAQLAWPEKWTFLLSLRGSVNTQSNDYLDTSDGLVKTNTGRPAGLSLGMGAFVLPSTLPAVTLSYKRNLKTGDPTQVCLPQALPTSASPGYGCQDGTIGVPTWKRTTSLRFELRQYLSHNVSWDPGLTYAWSGTQSGLFAQTTGLWQLEIPIYMQLPTTDKKQALVVGLSYVHRRTWGLGASNTSDDDLEIFLGGAFALGKL
jgi:hypothetical protein